MLGKHHELNRLVCNYFVPCFDFFDNLGGGIGRGVLIGLIVTYEQGSGQAYEQW